MSTLSFSPVRTAILTSILACPLAAQAAWSNAANAPVNRGYSGFVWDSVRSRLVLVGGFDARRHHDDTWERRGALWRRIPGAVPIGGPSLAFDPARNRVVLYGRSSSGPETWELDGDTWARVAGGPSILAGHAMTYDPVRRRTVLFGEVPGPDAQTWEWDGTTWRQATPQTSPPPRSNFGLVWHGGIGSVVLHGGHQVGATFGDLWEWTGSDWRSLGNGPTRRDHGLAYDASRNVLVLFAGRTGSAPGQESDETWEWRVGSGWQRRNPATKPEARYQLALAYDPALGRTVLYGGIGNSLRPLGDTWEWDGTDWMPTAAPPPIARAYAAMAYDDHRGRVVLFGGQTNDAVPRRVNDTWEWDGRAWQRIRPTANPSVRIHHAMAYDPVRRVVVMHGGFEGRDGVPIGETWEYDGRTWTLRSNLRQDRADRCAMAFDEQRGRIVRFGGEATLPGDKTWEWSGSAWGEIPTAVRPGKRQSQAMAYDGRLGRIVMFGGTGPGGEAGRLGDTWEFDGTRWRERPSGNVRPRYQHAMAYDTFRERVVMFGGFAPNSEIADETWEWDGDTWTLIGNPRGRHLCCHSMAYDAGNRQVVRFSGLGQPDVTWVYGTPNPAGFAEYGTACAGSGGSPHLGLAPFGWPWLGDDLELVLTELPPTRIAVPFGLIGTRPVDFDLTPIGMLGCRLLVDPLIDVPLVNEFGTARWTIPLSALTDPQFVGGQIHTQAIVVDPRANPLGAVTTNGGRATIGRR